MNSNAMNMQRDAVSQLSVVVPIFNESSVLHRFHARLLRVMERVGMPWEVI